jgi:hypothetical protein
MSTLSNAKRRSLLQAASLTPVAAAWLPSVTQAQDRKETLIVANEFGPPICWIYMASVQTARATALHGTATTA